MTTDPRAARAATPPPRSLTVAGSDSGGGAGIQADLKTFQAFGVYGMSAITALTAQNTLGVQGVHAVPPAFVRQQIDSVLDDIGADSVKTGMLANAGIISEVAKGLRDHAVGQLVVDPVSASKHGDALLETDAVAALKNDLLPLALVATPNIGEAELLTGVRARTTADLRAAAEAVLGLGPRWVLMKGGHLPDTEDAVDLLTDGDEIHEIRGPRLDTRDTHGTGCTLASGIAACLALGDDLVTAVRRAKRHVTGAIEHGTRVGDGIGPVHHGWNLAD